MDKVDRYIERVQHLPPAPTVVTQLVGLLGDPNRDTDQLGELVSYDPSLAAEVLRRCNSAFFRGAEPTADVLEAVSRLGFEEVNYVVTTLTGGHTSSLTRVHEGVDTGKLWWHSVTTAVAAGALASRFQDVEGEAFTAGLLHDVGKFALAAVEGAAYGNLVRQASCGLALTKAEEAGLGTTHAEVGARLLSRWGLPTKITQAILHHHHSPYSADPFERLAATIHLADTLAYYAAGGEPTAPDLASSGSEAMALLQLTASEVPAVLEQVQERLQRVQEALHIKT